MLYCAALLRLYIFFFDMMCLRCAYLLRPYLKVNPHDKADGLADQSMKKPILVFFMLL